MSDYKTQIHMLPGYMHGAMIRWIEHGILPADFLTAVLNNDLREAVTRADHLNKACLSNYIEYLHNYAPHGCWGSPANVESWAANKGLEQFKEQSDAG